MTKIISCLLLITSMFMFINCASTYKSINPRNLSYSNLSKDNNIDFSYQYGVLRMTRNKKYAKREDKKGLRVVAVKITNHTDQTLVLGQNYKILVGNREIVPLEPIFIHRQLKQGVPVYLLYLLLSPVQFTTTQATNGVVTQKSSFPIGLILGPLIAVGNMAVAGTANTHFKEELLMSNLIGKPIKPGETVYGLVNIQDFGFNPLTVQTTF